MFFCALIVSIALACAIDPLNHVYKLLCMASPCDQLTGCCQLAVGTWSLRTADTGALKADKGRMYHTARRMQLLCILEVFLMS